MADRTNVVVVNAIDEEALQLIRGVSDRLVVTDASDLTRAERNGDLTQSDELDRVLHDAEVVYALKLPERLLERCPNLKWIQTISTGVERVLDDGVVRSPVVVTNMSGIHEVTIAEFVLMLMLMFVKHAPRSFYQQVEGRFRWFPVDVLSGKTVGIV